LVALYVSNSSSSRKTKFVYDDILCNVKHDRETKFIGILKEPNGIILQFKSYLPSRMNIQEISGRFRNRPKNIYESTYIEVR